jgi:hypothetical protein
MPSLTLAEGTTMLFNLQQNDKLNGRLLFG